MSSDARTRRFRIKKGLDIPLDGQPAQAICDGNSVTRVALVGQDYPGLKPVMKVREGDRVKLGQTLFEDRRTPGVQFTAPVAGIVTAVRRGERRVLLSTEIQIDGDEEQTFAAFEPARLASLSGDEVRSNLLASGLWTALRTRPFSRIPAPESAPDALFVTAIDTQPLAADPAVVIADDPEAFDLGLQVLARLTKGPVYVCTADEVTVACADHPRISQVAFAGPHPAGLAGTHIHFLAPASERRTVWHIDYQDVIAVGRLFATGRLSTSRVIALGGPQIGRPRLVRARLGASIGDLVHGEMHGSELRVLSGSVLNGRRAVDWAAFLGRYHSQVTVLAEGGPREFLGWMMPGRDKFSVTRSFLGHLRRRARFNLSTLQSGSPRAMVSIGSFEEVMPLDILPTLLLKALLVGDTEYARQLGCLELDEEDLALCSFVCNGKYDYGPHLRRTLDDIEVNG